MARFLWALAATLIFATTVFAQGKTREATPFFDSLDGASKAAVTKAAKNIYKLPDGSLVDLSFYARFLEIEKKSWKIVNYGTVNSNGAGFSTKKVTRRAVEQVESDEFKAFQDGELLRLNADSLFVAVKWKDGKEERGAKVRLFTKTGRASKEEEIKGESFPVVDIAKTLVNEYVVLKISGNDFPQAFKLSTEVYKNKRFVGSEFIGYRLETTDEKGAVKPVGVKVDFEGEFEAWVLESPSAIRVSNEELAKACLEGKIKLRNHTWKKTAKNINAPVFDWSHTDIPISAKPQPKPQAKP